MHPAIAVAFGVLIGMAIGGGLIVAYLCDRKPKAEEVEDRPMILISITETDSGGMEGTKSHAVMQRMLDAILQREYRQLNDQRAIH